MTVERACKDDIQNGVAIDIDAKVIQKRTFDDGNTQVRLEDVEGERFDLKIFSGDNDPSDLGEGEWYTFENAEGDVYNGTAGITSNRGEMQFTSLAEPPTGTSTSQEPKPTEEDGGIVAIDIETISQVPESEFDFENSDHVELLCVGVGYSPEPGEPGKSDVIFRTGSDRSAEADLLQRLYEYVEEHEPAQLLMFKGDFDKRHLLGRAERLRDEIPELDTYIESLFTDLEVVNLDPWGSLEENADVPPTFWDIYNHSLDPSEWRADHPRYDDDPADPKVTNTDIPYFGEKYLELVGEKDGKRETRALKELLRHYTVADIEPLFELVEQ